MNDSATIADDRTSQAVALAERAAATMVRVRDGVGKVIFGQDEVIEQTLVTLLGGYGNAVLAFSVTFLVGLLVSWLARDAQPVSSPSNH
jgi:hypothetical protein